MKSKLSPLSRIDQLIQNIAPINILVDKIASKIAPKTVALAACKSGPGPGCVLINQYYTWYCWAATACGSNKCEYRLRQGWVCNNVGCIKDIWGCTSKTCVGPSNCP